MALILGITSTYQRNRYAWQGTHRFTYFEYLLKNNKEKRLRIDQDNYDYFIESFIYMPHIYLEYRIYERLCVIIILLAPDFSTAS